MVRRMPLQFTINPIIEGGDNWNELYPEPLPEKLSYTSGRITPFYEQLTK
jgi:hypothetical protein